MFSHPKMCSVIRFTFVFWLSLGLGNSYSEASEETFPFYPTPEQPGLDTAPVPPAPMQGAINALASPEFGIGPIGPVASQPQGGLSGRIVFMSAGHGWGWTGSAWALDRPLLNNMVEDFGNIDQMTLFAYYCFNAGAVVVPFRPVGNQTNEVVLDNDSPGVMFNGAWANSTSSVYFGEPSDTVPYRYANASLTENATATYTPNIPREGFYPVYCWALHGANRTNQLYRINHTGGQSLVRVPHHMVGNGWVYLGTYYFAVGANSATGAVIISNLAQGPQATGVVIADAIRFGNGMGDVDPGGGVSTYPREEESSRYWIQRSLGQGQSSTIYANGNVGAPARMAVEMNRQAEGNMYRRVYIGFHSNAGGSRGVTALHNNPSLFPGTATPNQLRLAELLAGEINSDLVGIGSPPLEVPWFNRSSVTFARTDFAFGEINNLVISNEFDATIVEVAYHDNSLDAQLLLDPKARNWVARSTYQGLVRYMNQYGGVPGIFLPEPPANVRATATNSGVLLSWSVPVPQAGSSGPTGYVVYASSDGYGFGRLSVVNGGANTSLLVSPTPTEATRFYYVTTLNGGGESLPSETVGCRTTSSAWTERVLIVNGFTRFDRSLNPRQTPAVRGYKPPGHDGNRGTMQRVLPRSVNSFDYVVPHGNAIAAAGFPFDSCQIQAITNRQVLLTNYTIVVWACGNESIAQETFSGSEQVHIKEFLERNGSLFVSGSDVAYDLGGGTSSLADRDFLQRYFRAGFLNDSSANYSLLPGAGGIFAGLPQASLDDGSQGIYWVPSPDVLSPASAGARASLVYGSGGVAAIQYDGSAGGGRVVLMGFPFETIVQPGVRHDYMAAILRFLTPLRLKQITILADKTVRLVLSGEPGTYELQQSADLAAWNAFMTVTITNSPVTVTTSLSADQLAGFVRMSRVR